MTLLSTPTTSKSVTGPAHDALPVVRTRPQFYLVGEAERSSGAPQKVADRTSIMINGKWHMMRWPTATYAQLVRIAYPERTDFPQNNVTVTFRGGAASRPSGLLTPGDVVPLVDGLVVNVDATYAS